MKIFLVLTALAASSSAGHGYATMKDAAQDLAPQMQTRTLLVSEGDCLAVQIFTQSPYTHVAAVVVRHGQPFVYDSANGVGVRCQTLRRYLEGQSPDEIHIFQPKEPFSTGTARQFEEYLDSQLGRPYAITHHLTGKRSEGMHCAEYVTDALQSCRLIHAKRPPKVSPASLVKGILQAELYSAAKTIRLKPPSSPAPKGDNWCSQLWIDTKTCTRNCYLQLSRWLLCR